MILALQSAFRKYDKRNIGSVKPSEVADVFRTAGQNPTNEEITKMIQEADEPGIQSIPKLVKQTLFDLIITKVPEW